MLRILSICAIFVVLGGAPAAAQQQCAPHDVMLAAAAEQYQEVPVFIALSQRHYVLEILASPAGTFTVLRVSPTDGEACMIDAGEGWQPPTVTRKGSF